MLETAELEVKLISRKQAITENTDYAGLGDPKCSWIVRFEAFLSRDSDIVDEVHHIHGIIRNQNPNWRAIAFDRFGNRVTWWVGFYHRKGAIKFLEELDLDR